MNTSLIYKASFDQRARRISKIVITMIVLLSLLVISLGLSRTDQLLNNILMLLPFWGLVGYWHVISVDSYILEEKGLLIKRILFPKQILFEEIKSSELLDEKSFKDLRQGSGSGGIFGYVGFYSDDRYGSMRWYATQKKNFILITLRSGLKIVITPDDTSLYTEIQNKIVQP